VVVVVVTTGKCQQVLFPPVILLVLAMS